jgi:hypothetical protein
MVTIDNIDIGVYIDYARRTQYVDEFTRQIRLQEAETIPAQLQVINLYPRMTEMDILLGVIPVTTPWAYFFPPKRFLSQRRSAFTFSQVAPLVTSFEKAGDIEKKLEELECEDEEEEEEKKSLLRCLRQVKKLNSWLSFIVGRMGQFLQG